MTDLANAPISRLLKKSGAARVGADATEAMIEVAEDYILRVGAEANKLARHAGRKTVKAEDIRLAVQRIQ